MKVVLLGATKGMGRALARRMADRGDALCLLGRDRDDLQRSAADLQVRGAAGTVGVVPCDLLDPAGFAPALDRAVEALGGLDAVVVTAGLFATRFEKVIARFALAARPSRARPLDVGRPLAYSSLRWSSESTSPWWRLGRSSRMPRNA